MKILILTKHLNLGGIGSYVFMLANGLAEQGHDVIVASSGGTLVGELSAKHITIDVDTKQEFSPKVLMAAYKLRKLVKDEKIDLIHAQTRVTSIIASNIAKSCKIPYLTTCHGFFRPHFMRRRFGFWGERVIAISEAVRRHLIEDLGVDGRNIRLVYNGINTAEFRIPRKSGGETIGCIARFSKVKGLEYLVMAMQDVVKNNPEAHLLLVGDGPEEEKLKKLSQKLGVEKNITFEHSKTKTNKILSCMDIFVLPSLSEGLGLSLIEAGAAGCALVGTSVGGIPEVIEDGVNGLLVPPKDKDALAKAVLRLLNNKDYARRLGETARRKVEEKFTYQEMIDKVEKVYHEAL